MIVPDSEDEDQADGGGLCCVSASQAAVQDLLLESPAAGSGSGGAHPQAAAWQASAVLPGVATLTLLLPRDARGELGLDTRCITLPLPPSPGNAAGAAGASAQRQMTAGAMLQLVHDHYSESLGNQEQLQLLQVRMGRASEALGQERKGQPVASAFKCTRRFASWMRCCMHSHASITRFSSPPSCPLPSPRNADLPCGRQRGGGAAPRLLGAAGTASGRAAGTPHSVRGAAQGDARANGHGVRGAAGLLRLLRCRRGCCDGGGGNRLAGGVPRLQPPAPQRAPACPLLLSLQVVALGVPCVV